MAQNRAKFHFDNTYDEISGNIGQYILYQAGDLNCEPGYHVMPHIQTVYEVSYVFWGSGVFYTNGKKYDVEKNTIFINKIGDSHDIFSSKDNSLRYFYIGFKFNEPIEDEAIRKLKTFFDSIDNPVRYNTEEISDLFLSLFSEILAKDFLIDITISSYINIIISTVYRTFNQKKYHSHFINEKSVTDKKLVYDIVNYIDTKVENISSLSILSEEFGYSYSHISKKFLSVMGESIKSYYTKRRFEMAKEYLSQGIDITKTAELVGFKSIHAFSRAFHKHFGETPSDYKNKQTFSHN